jgi:hypothetical protein
MPTAAKTAAKTAAERQAEYRARKGRQISLLLPEATAKRLDAYMKRHHADGEALTLSGVIAKLLDTQLLRRR